jgi:hypothetical protein
LVPAASAVFIQLGLQLGDAESLVRNALLPAIAAALHGPDLVHEKFVGPFGLPALLLPAIPTGTKARNQLPQGTGILRDSHVECHRKLLLAIAEKSSHNGTKIAHQENTNPAPQDQVFNSPGRESSIEKSGGRFVIGFNIEFVLASLSALPFGAVKMGKLL